MEWYQIITPNSFRDSYTGGSNGDEDTCVLVIHIKWAYLGEPRAVSDSDVLCYVPLII